MSVRSSLRYAPNLVINGAMDFWQRGVGPSSAGSTPNYVTADRYQIEIGGAQSGTTERSTTVPSTNFKYSIKFTSTSGTNSFQLWQRIEAINVKPYVGRYVTLSAWVMQTGEMDEVFLSIRNPSAAVDDTWGAENDTNTIIVNTVFAAAGWTTGVWRRISTTALLPAGAANGLVIGVEGSSVVTVGAARFITGVMLTEGSSAPVDFYRAGDSIGDELAMCQRYYEKSYLQGTAPGTPDSNGLTHLRAISTTQAATDAVFKVTKRISPSMVFVSRNNTSGTLTSDTVTSDSAVTISTPQTATTEDRVGVMTVASAVAGTFYRVHWTASAEL